MVPPKVCKLTWSPSAISPTIWSWADGHSFKTAGLKWRVTSLDVYPVLTKGLEPNTAWSHSWIKALRLKSLNIAIWPASRMILSSFITVSLPSVKVCPLYELLHYQLKTTQSGWTSLILDSRSFTASPHYWPMNPLWILLIAMEGAA